MTTILYILLAILLLGILIVVHEWGHFIASRMTGIAVKEFSVGFGPKLFGWQSKKHETAFSLRAIPLGGYCAFYSEEDGEENVKDDPRDYGKQAVWKRMIAILMGPMMNFVLAFVVTALYFWIGGVAQVTAYQPYIAGVDSAGPAYEAGIRANDVVETVNGVNVLDGTTDTLMAAIADYQAGDAPLHLVIDRAGETVEADLTPFYDEGLQRYRVGVTIGAVATQMEKQPVTLLTALSESGQTCVYAGGVIVNALKNLVTTGEGLDQTSGPVGVVTMVSQQVQQGGFDAFLNLLVVISINLGIMNLLPIPGLDGSRFLFMLLEAVRRKPVPPQKEAMVHLCGYVLLFGLMLFFTYKDILRLFQ